MHTGLEERKYWLKVLDRIARPVLTSLAEKELKKVMPVEYKENFDRHECTYLEALGRTLVGISPWLELDVNDINEAKLQKEMAQLSRRSIDAATDPESPDYLNFNEGTQPLVDTAFLAQAIVRAPKQLWNKLDNKTKKNLVAALKATRVIKPCFNNWLLFSAMIESALYVMNEDWDAMRIDYALKQFEQWYVGDGMYGDGPLFHWDYYNSFVIQPMLIDILECVSEKYENWMSLKETVLLRAKRYAEIQERLIAPDGTFPAIGRSLAYRFGAFHLIGQMALKHMLPQNISPAQVRSALTAVIQRMIEMPGTFDKNGWLKIGFCGNQPDIGERYISTGSLYLCTAGLLPLGLPVKDDFWKAEREDWTSKKVWSGQNIAADHAL